MIAGTQQAAVAKTQYGCGQAAHPAHRLCQRGQPIVEDSAAQHAGETAIGARMRLAVQESALRRDRRRIGTDGGARPGKRAAQIRLDHRFAVRPEKRREGKESVSTCKTRWSPDT